MGNSREDEPRHLENEKKGLSFEEHLHVLINYFVVFLPFTIFVLIINIVIKPSKLPFPQEAATWALTACVEIAIVVCVQALWDKLFRKKKWGIPSLVKKRFLDFGFQKKTSAPVMAMDAAILLFCILVPIDLLSYALPGTLAYVANSTVGLRFKGVPLPVYLTAGLVYNLATGLKEEFAFRGFLTRRLHEGGKRYSSWYVTSIFFGLLHIAPGDNIIGPVTWVTTATLVGFLFAGYSLSTKQVLPLIIAHGAGNFISAFSIWTFHSTAGFSTVPLQDFLLAFYLPMVLVGCVLAVLFRKRIKQGIQAFKTLARETRHEFVGSDAAIIFIMILVFFLTVALGMQL